MTRWPSERSVRAAYDQIAPHYAAEFSDELTSKPLDRALLAAFVELVGPGLLVDVGCGPGHVTRLLAEQHPRVTGIDLSSTMITIAKHQAPKPIFTVASMLNLPAPDAGWSGIVALYSIIHLSVAERLIAYREFARALHPGGWLLLAFHVDSDIFAIGDVNHLTTWFGQDVELDGFFLDPDDVTRQLHASGFTIFARIERQPHATREYPSRRCCLFAQRRPR